MFEDAPGSTSWCPQARPPPHVATRARLPRRRAWLTPHSNPAVPRTKRHCEAATPIGGAVPVPASWRRRNPGQGSDWRSRNCWRGLRMAATQSLMAAAPLIGGGADTRRQSAATRQGVFTINTKAHREAPVWVGGDTVMVNGRKHPYVRNSRHEATRAGRLLTAARWAGGCPYGASSSSSIHATSPSGTSPWTSPSPPVTGSTAGRDPCRSCCPTSMSTRSSTRFAVPPPGSRRPIATTEPASYAPELSLPLPRRLPSTESIASRVRSSESGHRWL
jgi:hypothetical protein